jgi:intracellular sulfur oxidation DsrE/DsrF family protein
MNKSTLRAAVAALAFALAGFSAVTAAADPAPATSARATQNRLVFQVSDAEPAKWNLALNNALNVQQDLGQGNVDIEIVVYGPGIGMLKMDSVAGNRIADAMASGVKVVACENTMRNQKLTRQDMLPAISYVPAGVVELMRKQQQGWAYLRP